MKSVILSPEALEELRDAVEWYGSWGETLGAAFLIEIDEILTRIGESPAQFPVYELDAGYRKAVLPETFPFIVYFREASEGAVEVTAVAHGARSPGYWLLRRP